MAVDADELAKDVELFLQDEPQFNLLRDGREFSPGQIRIAMRMMLSDLNQANWVSSFGLGDLQESIYSALIYGTIYHLMNMASILQTRNHLPYNDSGLSVGEWAKSGEYQALADRAAAAFEKSAVQYKWNLNVQQAMGGVLSQYSETSGWASIFGHSLDN